MRRFLPFAGLLGVAFVLGCQDVGTGPDGLVPQFHVSEKHPDGHGGGGDKPKDDATYEITHSGHYFTTDDPIPGGLNDPITGGPGVGKAGTSLSFGNVHARETIILSQIFVDQLVTFGVINNCFPEAITGPYVGKRAFGVLGGFRAGKGDIVTGSYVFVAFGTDGTTEVGYGLEVEGTATVNPFAPGPGKTTVVEWTSGLLHAQGDVAACDGGGGAHGDQKNVIVKTNNTSSFATIENIG